ncbi:MAG: hypothetical protein OXB93_03020, partial [Cytophagales bacterium]|nr:hypothetical protein [Cytophagales bacterium]
SAQARQRSTNAPRIKIPFDAPPIRYKPKKEDITTLLKKRLDICQQEENFEECIIIKKMLDIAEKKTDE